MVDFAKKLKEKQQMAASKKATSLVKWDEKFAALAKKSTAIVASIASGGNFIKLQGGQMSYQGAAVPGNSLEAVVIDHVLLNAFYEGKFDPDNPTSPVCFAFGEDADEMAPHADSPKKQDDDEGCAPCPQNEWASADTGKGKACKNMVRLCLISANDLEDVAKAEEAYLHVPVMSVAEWAGHVKLADETHHRPPLGVITRIYVVPDKKSQFKVKFELLSIIEDNDQIAALFEKYERLHPKIQFPFVQIEAAAKPVKAPKTNAKFAGKAKK